MKYLIILFCYFFINVNTTYSQALTAKQDTIYYLVDTTKIPINDRILEVKNTSLFKSYYFKCQCLDEGQIPYLIHRTKEKQEIINLSQMNNLKFISTIELLKLFHHDYYTFNFKHIIYILEVLPEQKLVKHLVTTGAIAMKM